MKNTTTTGSSTTNHTVTYDSASGDRNTVDARPLIDNAHPLAGRHPLEGYLGEGTREGVERWKIVARDALKKIFH